MDYKNQVERNVQRLISVPELKEKFDLLRVIVKRFEEEGVHWCLTCSSTLFFRGITQSFTDFDILVDWKDIVKAIGVMKELQATCLTKGDQSEFSSTLFNKYQIGNVKVDLFSEWRVESDFKFEYVWKADDCDEIVVDGVKLNIVSLKTQILLYSVFLKSQPNRASKIAACVECFTSSND